MGQMPQKPRDFTHQTTGRFHAEQLGSWHELELDPTDGIILKLCTRPYHSSRQKKASSKR